jgi:BlaI family penicillinase repressor
MGRKPRQKTPGQPDLTGLELEVMQVVWERGKANAAEVGKAFLGRRELAPTTIHTVLANLRKKGYLDLVPTTERALRYAPRVAREQVGGRRLRSLLHEFFGNSPRRLMAHLMQEGSFDEAELEEIRKLIQSMSRGGEEE